MEEIFKPKIEKEPEKPTTDIYMENLNLELWQELSCLTHEQQDERWFNLTQKHLKDYEQGKYATEEFKLEELEFLFFKSISSKKYSSLKSRNASKRILF